MFSLILAVHDHPEHRVVSVGKDFFGLFPGQKKSEVRRESESEGAPPGRVRGLRRLMARVLWPTTMKASWRMVLATCGPGPLLLATCSSSWCSILVEPGHSAHQVAAAVVELSWWLRVLEPPRYTVMALLLVLQLEPPRCEFMGLADRA